MVDKAAVIKAVHEMKNKAQVARAFGISSTYVGKIMREATIKPPVEAFPVPEAERIQIHEPPPPVFEVYTTVELEDTAPTVDIDDAVWNKLSAQDREAIHYGVVDMGNRPADVGACFGVGPEIVMRVIEIETQRRSAEG